MTNVHELIDQLQDLLGLDVTTGQITLNLSERQLLSVESKTYAKVKLPDDRRGLDERRHSAHS